VEAAKYEIKALEGLVSDEGCSLLPRWHLLVYILEKKNAVVSHGIK
jgi:hypothetical protein